jgi:pimeloyl-ACP methyl ester carboxylesterase
MGGTCCSGDTAAGNAGEFVKDTGAILAADGKEAAKASCLFFSAEALKGQPLPAVVMAHGACTQDWLTDKVFDLAVATKAVGDRDSTWMGMQDLAAAVAEQNIIVLLMGMPDGDDEAYPELAEHGAALMNVWPASDYSRSFSAAIDHLIKVAPEHGLKVDEKRVGIVGHSMGGAGALCAAARDCKDKVAACVALNAGSVSNPGVLDRLEDCKKYGTGKPFSGEYGEGTIEHLADVKVPTFIYGSQAEYNLGLDSSGVAAMWPCFPSVFEQLGAGKKELYVDNLIDNPGTKESNTQCAIYAHVWCYGSDFVRSYGDGAPRRTTRASLRGPGS